MVMNEKYKMAIKAENREPVELYDLQNDPNELHNLVEETYLAKLKSQLIDTYMNRLLKQIDNSNLKSA